MAVLTDRSRRTDRKVEQSNAYRGLGIGAALVALSAFGGAVGLAIINTVMNQRMDLHLLRLRESVTWDRSVAVETLDNMRHAMAPLGSDADAAGLAKLAGLVRQQAMTMAIGDVFYLLTGLFVASILLLALMKKPASGVGGSGH